MMATPLPDAGREISAKESAGPQDSPALTMDFNAFHENNSKNHVFSSVIPEIAKTEPCMLGVDEAGRGPVLGPMVYGICFCPLNYSDELKSLKFSDSKVLSEEQRENMFTEICKNKKFIGWMLEIIPANVISNSMLRRSKYNLNLISHDSAANLISKVVENGANIKEVYVDTVGDPSKYQDKLSKLFPDIKVTVAKKADSTYPIVSAASICAKVARDTILKSWKFKESVSNEERNYGSGYPSDPQTKSYVTENIDPVFGFTQLVRFSWSTAAKLLDEKAASVVWEDVSDEPEVPCAASVLKYFKRSSSPPPKKLKIHSFFEDRMLHPVSNLWD